MTAETYDIGEDKRSSIRECLLEERGKLEIFEERVGSSQWTDYTRYYLDKIKSKS